MVELAKKFTQQNGHTKEHYGSYRIADISSEHVWIQSNPSSK
jgi:hypothetical protein